MPRGNVQEDEIKHVFCTELTFTDIWGSFEISRLARVGQSTMTHYNVYQPPRLSPGKNVQAKSSHDNVKLLQA